MVILGDSLLYDYRYSYEYITKSVIAQKLEELERHRVLPKGRPTASGPSRLRGYVSLPSGSVRVLGGGGC